MIYEFKNRKVLTEAIEYSVSYHCNLKCSGCSHMSPFLRKKFPTLESFSSDVEFLSRSLHANDIRLVGGEPLLNPEINDYILTAKQSGIADNVNVTTNGLLLHKMNQDFWENVDFVSVTLYPGASPDAKFIQKFKGLAKESNTRLLLSPCSTFRTTIVTEPHPMDQITDMIFKTCKGAHLYHCHMIHEGRLFKCAVPPFLPEYLSGIGLKGYEPESDAYNIHGNGDAYEKLKGFVSSTTTLEACRYCLGYVGKFQDSHQLSLDSIKNPKSLNLNRKKNLDPYKFTKETVRYCRRRLFEKATGKPRW